MDDPDHSDLPRPPGAPTDAPAIVLGNAGNVVSTFPTNLVQGFGLIYDTSVDRIWIANTYYPDFGYLGDGLEHQFLPDGTDTGETIDIHDTGGIWQADGTYNGRTGMLWQVNVAEDNCLFEMDPVTKVVTGNKICGPWIECAARRGLRLRDRHLLRRRQQRRDRLPHRRRRQPPRLRVRRPRNGGPRVQPDDAAPLRPHGGRRSLGRLGARSGRAATPSSAASASPAAAFRCSSSTPSVSRPTAPAASGSTRPDSQIVYALRVRRDGLVRQRHPVADGESRSKGRSRRRPRSR